MTATFFGNIFDENDNIDCKYQAYHVQLNKWSDVRTSEYNQYNVDLGDETWLGSNNTSTNNNETVLICFWTELTNSSNTSDRFGKKDKLSVLVIELDNSSVYINDAQVIQKTNPTAISSIATEATIGELVQVVHSSNDDYSWDFNGNVFRQIRYFDNELIFDCVDDDSTLKHEFDWNGNGTFISDDTNIFQNSQIYDVVYKCTNQYDLFSTIQMQIKIKYNSPSYNLTHNNKLKYLETITIKNTVNDVDNTISKIKYFFDDELMYEDTAIQSQYTYDKLLNEFKTHISKIEVIWFDGFDAHNDVITDNIEMINTDPTINLEITQNKNNYTFISNVYDFENRNDYVEFIIYENTNYIFNKDTTNPQWKEIDNRQVLDANGVITCSFFVNSHFKVTAQAFDKDDGSSSIDEIEFNVQSQINNNVIGGNQYFEWE